jgi:acyl-ACP thioesterase
MTVAALVKVMQEAAMQNVIQIKVSAWDMELHNISWVLMRKHLKVNRLPSVHEPLKVVTYPAGFEKLYTYRDYLVYGPDEELLATSSSTWLLMNTLERKVVRIPAFVLDYEKHMPSPEMCLPRPLMKLPPFEAADASLPFRVNWHDLDFNGHLNNLYYLQWMLETLPDRLLEEGTLKEFDIAYKMEAHWKEEVRSELQVIDDQHFAHRLVRISDGKELAVGRSCFGRG